jgi:hypothetical protein
LGEGVELRFGGEEVGGERCDAGGKFGECGFESGERGEGLFVDALAVFGEGFGGGGFWGEGWVG